MTHIQLDEISVDELHSQERNSFLNTQDVAERSTVRGRLCCKTSVEQKKLF